MPPLVFYRCSKCRREFDCREKAQDCEDNHLTVTSARVQGYGVHPYPYAVEVTFSNGEMRIYLAENQR